MAAQATTLKDVNALTGRTYSGFESGVTSLSALLQRLATWYERNRAYRETVAELSRLSDHILADVGMGRHEIEEIARSLGRRAG